jgi:2-polyprenyl-3-methyl-5-hydroxy-6-metoxy-1,4-benzoquinol methylase
MNPQPEKNEVMRRYREAYGKDYLSYELNNEDKFLELQLLALKDSGFEAHEKDLFAKYSKSGILPNVLDIGCATGALLEHFANRGWRVTGVEISPSAEYARKKRNLNITEIPLEENNFPPETFDIIHASHFIEHVNDPRSFLGETRRILKHDGRIFITTPNIAGFQARLLGNKWRSAIFDHLYLFSARTLKSLLEDAGFIVEGIYTWGGLAEGLAPLWLKKIADSMAKRLNTGDVMMVKARKNHLRSFNNTHVAPVPPPEAFS